MYVCMVFHQQKENLLTLLNFVYKQPNSKLLRSWLISEILHRYNCIVDRQHIAIDIIMIISQL